MKTTELDQMGWTGKLLKFLGNVVVLVVCGAFTLVVVALVAALLLIVFGWAFDG